MLSRRSLVRACATLCVLAPSALVCLWLAYSGSYCLWLTAHPMEQNAMWARRLAWCLAGFAVVIGTTGYATISLLRVRGSPLAVSVWAFALLMGAVIAYASVVR